MCVVDRVERCILADKEQQVVTVLHISRFLAEIRGNVGHEFMNVSNQLNKFVTEGPLVVTVTDVLTPHDPLGFFSRFEGAEVV